MKSITYLEEEKDLVRYKFGYALVPMPPHPQNPAREKYQNQSSSSPAAVGREVCVFADEGVLPLCQCYPHMSTGKFCCRYFLRWPTSYCAAMLNMYSTGDGYATSSVRILGHSTSKIFLHLVVFHCVSFL